MEQKSVSTSAETANRQQKESRSTRLVSADAYRSNFNGGVRALQLLDQIRRSPLTAASPESGIDLERVGFHAAQAVTVGIAVTIVGLILLILIANDLGYLQYFGFFGGLWNFIISQIPGIGLGYSFAFRSATSMSWLLAALLAFESILLLWWIQTRNFKFDNYNPQFTLPIPEGLRQFFRAYIGHTDPSQNVVTFGSFQPFVGSGATLSDWQFVMDLSRPSADKPATQAPSIMLSTIYDGVEQAIKVRGLPNLRATDILYVNGDRLETDPAILPRPDQRPISRIDSGLIVSKRENTEVASEQRVYKAYTYEDTRHDTTTSAFLHLARYGSTLYVEAAFRVLLPINEDVYNIDKRTETTLLRRILWWVGLTVIYVFFPVLPLLAIVVRIYTILQYLLKWFQDDRRQRNAAKRNTSTFNYGIPKTFRESVAHNTFASYFAMKDTVAYKQSLEECFLDAVLDTLEKAGVDVSSLRQRADAYFVNNGIQITGGSINAGQLAVGQGANNLFSPASPGTGGLFQQAGSAVSQTINRVTGSSPSAN